MGPSAVRTTTNTHIVWGVNERFGYAIDWRYLPLLLPFLLRPASDGVTLTGEDVLVATFGLFKVATPLSNIAGAHITRNYRRWTAFGVRMSRADDGLTFGTNHARGRVYPLRRERAVTPAKKRPFCAYRDRCRFGGTDNGVGRRQARAIFTLRLTDQRTVGPGHLNRTTL